MKRLTSVAALGGFLIIALLTFAQPAKAEESPMAELKSTADRILAIIVDESISGPGAMKKKLDMAWEIIQDYFADEEMTRRTMAKHWKPLTQEQKKEFIYLYSQLLRRSYVSKLELFEGQEISYDKERLEGEYAKIDTSLKYHGENIPLGYSLIKSDGRWKIYDMVIDGVSLIANYRRQFNKIIRKEGYEGLVKRLKNKLAEEKALEGS